MKEKRTKRVAVQNQLLVLKSDKNFIINKIESYDLYTIIIHYKSLFM